MVYDAADQSALIWGGEDGYNYAHNANSTWTFANDTWTNVTPVGAGPSGYSAGASMVYDSEARAVLLALPDFSFTTEATWTFRAGSWTELTPVREPSSRWYAAMAYDPLLNETLLFGGLSSLPNGSELWLADTWAFSNGNWTLLSEGTPTTTEQLSQTMAFDPATGQLVLVTDALSPLVSGQRDFQTFVFNGTGWVDAAAPLPEEVFGGFSTLSYDPAFGGLVGQELNNPEIFLGNQSTQTAVFAGGAWRIEDVGGYPTRLNGMVYDSAGAYGLGFSIEPTLNLTGPPYRGATWVLNSTTVGPPPKASIRAAAYTLQLGAPAWVGASFDQTFGYTWFQMGTDAPGCAPAANAEWMTCTPLRSGTFWFYFTVLDQAGRTSNVSLSLRVVAPLIPGGSTLVGVWIGVGSIVCVAAFVVWARRIRRRRKGSAGRS